MLAAFAGSALTAVVLLFFRSGKGAKTTSSGAPASTGALAPGQTRPPTAAGVELTRLIDAGRSQTFHGRYQATSTDPAAAGSQVTLDLWRKPPREREELLQVSGGRSVRSAGFLLPPISVLCRQADANAAWTCANTPQTQADDLLKGVTGDVAGQAAAVRDDTVASRPVRCFGVPGAQPSELCLTPQGITARLTTGSSKIELVDLSFDVPDDVFAPPATPTP